jgi:manganese-dependent inorganic pyrophosphatase
MITGLSLFNFLARHIGPQIRKQDVKLAEVLDMPCSEACDADVPRFTAATHIRDVLNRLLRLAYSEFVITDDKGLYLGVARQSEVLNPPRLQVILVDHNEPGQALGAIEEAQILEILDHHRLGNMPTRTPIKFSVDTVGSTSTLVSERIEEAGLSAPPPIAGMLLSGLLSDTLILTSPTTTERDRCAADRLGRWAFVKSGPLAGETIETYGRALVDAGAGISTRKPEEIVSTDIKVYDAGGYKFLIAQVEVTDLRQLTEHLEALRSALDDLRNQRGLDFAMLMVTDVVDNISRLVLVNPPPMLDDLPYPLEADGTRLATGVVSRKKQLLPTVLGLLEA